MSDFTFTPQDTKKLAPVRRAAAKLQRAEERAAAARDELATAMQTAHKRDGFSIRELGFVVGLKATAAHALLRRKNGGRP